MPKYEMMYIVASSVSDDQIPVVTDGVLKFITDLGGSVIKEEKLGKKKLAYPIKKTRNGFYDVVAFEMDGSKVSALDTKMLTTEGIIRHLTVNIEDALIRIKKDAEAQEKMNRSRSENAKTAEKAKPEITEENIDEKIEEALSEDLSNV